MISTNITTHYDLAKPIIEAGKDIYVEWPLGSTVAEAEELANLAREKGIKTAVGLQGRFEEAVDVVKRVVEEEKRIGDVLSVKVEASTGLWGATVPALHKYTVDGHSGGTFTTIYSGHCEFIP